MRGGKTVILENPRARKFLLGCYFYAMLRPPGGPPMAYEQHPKLKTPPDRDAYIWRYIDFTKFISMLSRRSLFFASVAALAQSDKFEGQLTWPASTSPAAPPGFKTAEELASIG
jgi:hypothetical protein